MTRSIFDTNGIPYAFVGVPPLKYIQKYNSIFFQSLQDSLTAQSPKCKIIRSFAGSWFCFGRFVSYLWLCFSFRSFRLFRWFRFGRLVSSSRVLVHARFLA